MTYGRIWFPGNPWPDGHRIAEFVWAARLDQIGCLWFDLTLKTADYDEEAEPPEPDSEAAWESPMVWQNYHRCSMSSTLWEDATGLLAATPDRPFRFLDSQPAMLTADPLPIVDLDADPAFHIYLLGHDSVAGHQVTFTPATTGGFTIDWTGRVALTYAGQDEYRYRFRAQINPVTLQHVAFPADMTPPEARRHLAVITDAPGHFVQSREHVLHYMPSGF